MDSDISVLALNIIRINSDVDNYKLSFEDILFVIFRSFRYSKRVWQCKIKSGFFFCDKMKSFYLCCKNCTLGCDLTSRWFLFFTDPEHSLSYPSNFIGIAQSPKQII
jgi:hypothetical protein